MREDAKIKAEDVWRIIQVGIKVGLLTLFLLTHQYWIAFALFLSEFSIKLKRSNDNE